MSRRVEEYIENYTKRCSNEDGFDYVPWLTPDNARRAAQIAREEVIEKAVEWLTNWDKYRVCLEGRKDWFIEQFKKAMEEKV